ncbi:bestrophin-like domain [Bradyrhizobium sp. UFLA05-112]
MIFMFFAVAIAAVFFVGSMISLNFGRRLGLRYRKHTNGESTAGLSTVEGAIFGLMGLLLAFTISGALQRFDDRRQLVLQETTAVAAAYDRTGLFERDTAHELRSKLKDYVRARVDLYRMQHDFLLWKRMEDFSREQQSQLVQLKEGLWNAALAACPKSDYQPACSLTLPALNTAFEIARLRAGAAEKHPPQIIYLMLFGLGLGCSLLAGFGMAASAARSWVHMILFAGVLTVALYIVTDMEYPRLGLIRIESFDHFLADAYDQMR